MGPQPENLLRENKLFAMLRPIIILMRLGGMFYVRACTDKNLIRPAVLASSNTEDQNGSHEEKKSSFRWRAFEFLCSLYSTAMFVLMMLFAVKFMYGVSFGFRNIAENDPHNLTGIVDRTAYLVWLGQIVVIHYVFLRNCRKENGIVQLFISWKHNRYISPDSSAQYIYRKVKFRARIVSAVATLHVMIHLVLQMLPLFYAKGEFLRFHLSFFEGYTEERPELLAINVIGMAASSFVWIVPSYLFAIVGSVILLNFWMVNRDMTREMESTGKLKSIEWYRLSHSRVCKFLEVADGIFSPFVFFVIGGSVIQILFIVFTLNSMANIGQYNSVLLGFHCYWLCTYFFQIALVMWVGSLVNQAAHAPLASLYELDMSALTVPECHQVQVFLNKLTCNRIGFTVWKLFTLDNTAVLTAFGMYVTYQILVFQTQLDLRLDQKVEEINPCGCAHRADGNVTQSHVEPKTEL